MGWRNCLKFLKSGGREKRGKDTKILKGDGDKLGQGVGVPASKSPHFLWYMGCL